MLKPISLPEIPGSSFIDEDTNRVFWYPMFEVTNKRADKIIEVLEMTQKNMSIFKGCKTRDEIIEARINNI